MHIAKETPLLQENSFVFMRMRRECPLKVFWHMRKLYKVRNKLPSRATAFAFYDAFRDVIQQAEDWNYAGLKSMAEVVNEEKKDETAKN